MLFLSLVAITIHCSAYKSNVTSRDLVGSMSFGIGEGDQREKVGGGEVGVRGLQQIVQQNYRINIFHFIRYTLYNSKHGAAGRLRHTGDCLTIYEVENNK